MSMYRCGEQMSLFPYVGGTHQHPWRAGSRNATTLQAEGPIHPYPSRHSGEKRLLEGGISTVSEAISEIWANHGKRGHLGSMIVATATYLRSFAMRSSGKDHGGFHQLFSSRLSRSERWIESTVSAFASLHLALYRGSCLFLKEVKRSTEWGPHNLLK
jgi:hypothetical protein